MDNRHLREPSGDITQGYAAQPFVRNPWETSENPRTLGIRTFLLFLLIVKFLWSKTRKHFGNLGEIILHGWTAPETKTSVPVSQTVGQDPKPIELEGRGSRPSVLSQDEFMKEWSRRDVSRRLDSLENVFRGEDNPCFSRRCYNRTC